MKMKVMMVREGKREKFPIESPEAAFIFMKAKAQHLDREHFWRIDLDARNNAISYEEVSVGTATASLVAPSCVFRGAILAGAVSVIIAHNHPSQETDPSREDRDTTKRLKDAGSLLGIPVVDHLILADNEYFSFRQGGLL